MLKRVKRNKNIITKIINASKSDFTTVASKNKLNSAQARVLQNWYIGSRKTQPTRYFDDTEVGLIRESYLVNPKGYNKDHPRVNPRNYPTTDFMDKGISDKLTVDLWNTIMKSSKYSVKYVSQIKGRAAIYINDLDVKCPKGIGATESELIRYIQAQSASSYTGIQRFNESLKSLESMKSTLNAHCNPRIVSKPWLTTNLQFVDDYLRSSSYVMEKGYGDLCLLAKSSSSSIAGDKRKFREFVLETPLSDIIAQLDYVPLLIYMGTREDRRGKYRLICSFDGRFRVIDFILNNGSYELCSHDGLLSEYTTEGYSNRQMWPELKAMADRSGGYEVACIDYEGYDTQISLEEYLQISWLLNRHRAKNNPEIMSMFRWYAQWMRQPKPLVTRSLDGLDVLIEQYITLASGLHGTHSFENLIGISAYLEAKNRGIDAKRFWTNGDDQNTKLHSSDMDRYIEFMNMNFKISWDKSLVGHTLAVWGKLWFTEDLHPMWEMGTFRSIFERETGEVNYVEDSKFESNFCKIVQVAITMIRLGENTVTIQNWIRRLCGHVGIPHDVIPKFLNQLDQLPTSSLSRHKEPLGLLSQKSFLYGKTFNIKTLEVNNYYDMLLSMYSNNSFYTLQPKEISYYPKGTELYFEPGVDYSHNYAKEIPWIYSRLAKPTEYTDQQLLVRSILQSSNSFDGPVNNQYRFTDILSLAYAINERNARAWYDTHMNTF